MSMNSADNVNTGAPTYVFANGGELTNVKGYRTFPPGRVGRNVRGLQHRRDRVLRARLPFRVFILVRPGQQQPARR